METSMKNGDVAMTILACVLMAALPACSGDSQGETVAVGSGAAHAWQAPAAQAGAEVPPTRTAPADTRHLVSAQVVDSQGFAQPMVAMRLAIPAGWSMQGGVEWRQTNSACAPDQYAVQWRALAPDGVSVLENLPNASWQQQASVGLVSSPCPRADLPNVQRVLEAQVQRFRPGARSLDYRELPQLAQHTREVFATAIQRMGLPMMDARIEAGSVLLAYPQNGVDMREVLTATVSYVGMAGYSSTVAYRAPNGQLDLSLSERVVASLESNPVWEDQKNARIRVNSDRFYANQSRQISDWNDRSMDEIRARGAAGRAAIAAIAARGGTSGSGSSWSPTVTSSGGVSDEDQRRRLEAIGEYDTYTGVDGTDVQSSIHGGDRVFQNTSDPYSTYSTNDPYATPADGYTELQQRE
jgi:hypothetical protein